MSEILGTDRVSHTQNARILHIAQTQPWEKKEKKKSHTHTIIPTHTHNQETLVPIEPGPNTHSLN